MHGGRRYALRYRYPYRRLRTAFDYKHHAHRHEGDAANAGAFQLHEAPWHTSHAKTRTREPEDCAGRGAFGRRRLPHSAIAESRDPAMAAPTAERFDPKLQRVAHALENLTRVGAPVRCGISKWYCLPGLFFLDDERNGEIFFPLNGHGIAQIQTRATSVAGQSWRVDGASLEVRNPRWSTFVQDCFDPMRERMGISESAEVTLELKSLVMVTSGGRLFGEGEEEPRRERVFGKFVVVLPGMFEGGDVVCQLPREEVLVWQPADRSDAYTLAFSALHHQCTVVSDPVSSGVALFLVYDLQTSTPAEVPLCADTNRLQRSVCETLSEYFDMTPESLTKRLKITADVWRSINEFVSDRPFVYIVGSGSYEELDEHEQTVAEALVRFCEESVGQYVLYLSCVQCSRDSHSHHDDEEDAVHDVGLHEGLEVCLVSPWRKYGEPTAWYYSAIKVDPLLHVAPLGQAGRVELYAFHASLSLGDRASLRSYYSHFDVVGETYALVVQPAPVEQRQMTNLAVDDAMRNLVGLLQEPREIALPYARRVVEQHAPWKICDSDDANHVLRGCLTALVALNDLELFKDMLCSTEFCCYDAQGSYRSAIEHFGWDGCVATLARCIHSTPTFRGRINLIASVVDSSLDSAFLDQLLEPLLALHPWTSMQTDTGCGIDSRLYEPEPNVFERVLSCACSVSSSDRILHLVSVVCPSSLIRTIIPALPSLYIQVDCELWERIFHHVSETFDTAIVHLRNQPYENARLPTPTHCERCREIHTFMVSNDIETQIIAESRYQREHVKELLHNIKFPAKLKTTTHGTNTFRILKKPRPNSFRLYYAAEEAKQILKALQVVSDARDELDSGSSASSA